MEKLYGFIKQVTIIIGDCNPKIEQKRRTNIVG